MCSSCAPVVIGTTSPVAPNLARGDVASVARRLPGESGTPQPQTLGGPRGRQGGGGCGTRAWPVPHQAGWRRARAARRRRRPKRHAPRMRLPSAPSPRLRPPRLGGRREQVEDGEARRRVRLRDPLRSPPRRLSTVTPTPHGARLAAHRNRRRRPPPASAPRRSCGRRPPRWWTSRPDAPPPFGRPGPHAVTGSHRDLRSGPVRTIRVSSRSSPSNSASTSGPGGRSGSPGSRVPSAASARRAMACGAAAETNRRDRTPSRVSVSGEGSGAQVEGPVEQARGSPRIGRDRSRSDPGADGHRCRHRSRETGVTPRLHPLL